MLREDFQLRFRAANAAKIKYNDVSFDDKRVWVSRLLAQFMVSGVVIVSIDESSFKSEGVVKQYWQPGSKTIQQLFNHGPGITDDHTTESFAEEEKASPDQVEPRRTQPLEDTSQRHTPEKHGSIGLTPV